MMDFNPQPLYWFLAILLVVHYFACIGDVLCSELTTSEGYCTADDDTSCARSGELEDQSVSGLNSTLILGKHPERHITDYSPEVYISVKTTASYHEPRLAILLLTWMQTLKPKQVHIVTDADSDDHWTSVARSEGFTVFGANCSIGHQRKSLCCKSGVEYEQYYAAKERGEKYEWFCHFDDDIYVNIQALVATLGRYKPSEERRYFGRWSVNKKEKMEITEQKLAAFPNHKSSSYYFATGASYCISSSLMGELEPFLRGTAFEVSGKNLQLPDDMVVGAVVGAVLGYELTEIAAMNSHLNSLARIQPDTLQDQITISYGKFQFANKPMVKNLVNIPNAVFDVNQDPTRFLSYHCFLYPSTKWCNSQ